MGHAIGDELLIAVAQRIRCFLRNHDMVGWLGADEFLIMLTDSSHTSTELTTQRLLEGFSTPFQVTGHTLQISPFIGVAMFPDHGEDAATLLKHADTALRETDLHPSRLELEITESAAMHNPQDSMRILGALKMMGMTIAIDDFGTGYSSLSYLKRIPADVIKIDKSFVDGLNSEVDDTAIVRTIIALADTLEKQTIAEGIETREQYEGLRELGCNFAQGYWFSEPVSAEAFEKLFQGELQNRAKIKGIQ